jgi:hypothetical protein
VKHGAGAPEKAESARIADRSKLIRRRESAPGNVGFMLRGSIDGNIGAGHPSTVHRRHERRDDLHAGFVRASINMRGRVVSQLMSHPFVLYDSLIDLRGPPLQTLDQFPISHDAE